VLTKRVEEWLGAGELEEIDRRRIFVRDRPGSGPPVLLLHGYPSSSYDWRYIFGEIEDLRLTAFDFLGFGLSDKPRDHRYSLRSAADTVQEIVLRFGDEPVVVAAHDMATSVVTEMLARDLEGTLPFTMAAVLLFNGSMVIERATLTVSQRLLRSRFGSVAARLSNETAFRAQFARIFSEAHPLTDEEAADQWSLIAHNGGNRILDRLTAYLRERVQYADRWHGALRDWPGRLELAWGLRDPVSTRAVLDAVRGLRPAAPVTELPELGHYPQLEDPGAIAPLIRRIAAEAANGSG
jgi:pimeloyl-ACP methyl ester carboxylesterase